MIVVIADWMSVILLVLEWSIVNVDRVLVFGDGVLLIFVIWDRVLVRLECGDPG